MTPPATVGAWSLADPRWLVGLGLAVPLVLLHLHHRRRVVVPFLPLLVEAAGPRRAGGGWRRLRERLPLLLRLAALALAVLALAGLAPRPASPPPPALLLLVDADVTTGAREADGTSRLEGAVGQARAWLDAAPWPEVTVVAAAAVPETWIAPTRDLAAARRALEARRQAIARGETGPSPGTTDLDAALRVLTDLGGRRPPARVLVLSARALTAPPAPDGVTVEVLGTGAARDDQAIVDLTLRPAEDEVHLELELTVRSEAETAVRREVLVEVAGETAWQGTVDLEPGGAGTVRLDVLPPRAGGWLEARLVGDDALAAGDVVTAWLAPPLRPSVLVVHDGGVRPWVRAVLDAMGAAIDLEASGTVAARDLARAEPRDVILVDGAPVDAGALRPGAWIFVAPLAGTLPFDVLPAVDEPLVWRTSPDHPLVRDLDLATAWVARGQPVAGDGLEVLAEAEGHAVLAEGERDGVRFVVLGLDPDRSDLPVRAALPLLIRGAILRLAAQPARPLPPFVRAGTPLRPLVPLPGDGDAVVTWPGGRLEGPVRVEGETLLVPRGARGRAVLSAPGPDGAAWSSPTAFVDLDPARRIAPARPPAPWPESAPPAPDPARRWRGALLGAAALLLLLDLVVLAAAGRPRAGLASPGGHA